MPTENTAGNTSDDDTVQQLSWTGRLRKLIRKCPQIPEPVSEAKFARVNERLFDESLFKLLTEQCAVYANSDAEVAAIQRRANALAPYIGRNLVCVLVTLPGVCYTIEIDESDESVVHWEWQDA